MDLYILRHGKAEKVAPRGDGDAGRALTRRGRSEVQEIAAWTSSRGIFLDLIATSPLTRAFETAEILSAAYPAVKGPVVWDALAPGMDFNHLMSRIRDLELVSSLILIGHEPSLSACISRIIAGDERVRLSLKKGGLARIENFSPAEPVTGELAWLLSPRHMRKQP